MCAFRRGAKINCRHIYKNGLLKRKRKHMLNKTTKLYALLFTAFMVGVSSTFQERFNFIQLLKRISTSKVVGKNTLENPN